MRNFGKVEFEKPRFESCFIWWWYYWLWESVPRLDDSVCKEMFVKVGFGDGCSYTEWVTSRRWIRCKRKEIRKVNCSEPMDNSVTEDKVINEATVFEWLELTIVESFWVSGIFETRESLSEISLNAFNFQDHVYVRGGPKLWKHIPSKGRTYVLYALMRRVGLCVMKHLNKRADLCLARLTMSCTCPLNFKFGSIRMPRSLIAGVGSMVLLERLKFKSGVWLPRWRMLHLLYEMLICHVIDQSWMIFIGCSRNKLKTFLFSTSNANANKFFWCTLITI